MNPDLRVQIEKYIESLFVAPDPVLTHNISDADAAGLPAIQVSPNQGKLLYLLAKMCGASRVLEIGTLGGYSTTWLARALPDGGIDHQPRAGSEARRRGEKECRSRRSGLSRHHSRRAC